MKRLEKLLTEIYQNEFELLRYSMKDIRKVIDKIEKENGRAVHSTLLEVIYTDESRED